MAYIISKMQKLIFQKFRLITVLLSTGEYPLPVLNIFEIFELWIEMKNGSQKNLFPIKWSMRSDDL